tara:strand:+ start:105 stop:548 length:444 start_codon:yes stop_codon:yes gene_type:complete
MTARLMLAVLAPLLLGGFGPFLIFPGGELSGTASEPPDSWAFTDAIATIQLETRPADPYSVNIWITRVDAAIYVHAGANRATWVEHIEADPDVRVQIGEQIFSLRATRVRDAEEFARFSDAYEKKYDRRPRNENVAEVYLFRLTPRE